MFYIAYICLLYIYIYNYFVNFITVTHQGNKHPVYSDMMSEKQGVTPFPLSALRRGSADLVKGTYLDDPSLNHQIRFTTQSCGEAQLPEGKRCLCFQNCSKTVVGVVYAVASLPLTFPCERHVLPSQGHPPEERLISHMASSSTRRAGTLTVVSASCCSKLVHPTI